LIDESFHVLLSDIGLLKLKKYAAITLGYTAKSGWSSPEVLADRLLVCTTPKPSDDIYSFGVLLWEMNSYRIPFQDVTISEITAMVVK
jgi:serine/threonine protein kinase